MTTSYKLEPTKSKLLDKQLDKLTDEEANRLIEVMRVKEKVNTEHTEFLKGFEDLVKN